MQRLFRNYFSPQLSTSFILTFHYNATSHAPCTHGLNTTSLIHPPTSTSIPPLPPHQNSAKPPKVDWKRTSELRGCGVLNLLGWLKPSPLLNYDLQHNLLNYTPQPTQPTLQLTHYHHLPTPLYHNLQQLTALYHKLQ